MTRRVLLLIAAMLAAGCVEDERPRFTPASGGAVPAGPREPARTSREVAIPRNIETH